MSLPGIVLGLLIFYCNHSARFRHNAQSAAKQRDCRKARLHIFESRGASESEIDEAVLSFVSSESETDDNRIADPVYPRFGEAQGLIIAPVMPIGHQKGDDENHENAWAIDAAIEQVLEWLG